MHEEARRWEHLLSENGRRTLPGPRNKPTVSPFGHPSPGLDSPAGSEPRGGETSAVLDALTLLSSTATPEGRRVQVSRISEQLQEDPERLRALNDLGVRPGVDMVARVEDGVVTLDGHPVPTGAAQHLFVRVLDEELTPAEAAASL